jgi:hypothetical protein
MSPDVSWAEARQMAAEAVARIQDERMRDVERSWRGEATGDAFVVAVTDEATRWRNRAKVAEAALRKMHDHLTAYDADTVSHSQVTLTHRTVAHIVADTLEELDRREAT